jgi:RimJ/RimL family protein N-acetyltransferase
MFKAADFTLIAEKYSICVITDDALDTYTSLFTDSKTMKCIGPVLPSELAQQHFFAALRSSSRKRTPQLYLSIKLADTAKVVGIFSVRTTALDKSVEVGIMLLRQYHCKGLAKDVVKAVCNRIFTCYNVKSIFCNIQQRNLAARKLVGDLGFTNTGSGLSYRLDKY